MEHTNNIKTATYVPEGLLFHAAYDEKVNTVLQPKLLCFRIVEKQAYVRENLICRGSIVLRFVAGRQFSSKVIKRKFKKKLPNLINFKEKRDYFPHFLLQISIPDEIL